MFPLATEKCMRLIEAENKIVMIVDGSANKQQIKRSVEEQFGVKVGSIGIVTIKSGKKKAYITIVKGKAADVATKLGVI